MNKRKRLLDDDEVVEKKSHNPFEQYMVDRLIFILERKEKLTAWEKSFVKDRAGAFDTYGFNAVITDKQLVILNDLYSKVRLSALLKEIDT